MSNPLEGRETATRTDGDLDESVIAQIIAATEQLDPNKDDHWKSSGLPSLHWLRMHTAIPTLTRDEVEQAVPGVVRSDLPAYDPEKDGYKKLREADKKRSAARRK